MTVTEPLSNRTIQSRLVRDTVLDMKKTIIIAWYNIRKGDMLMLLFPGWRLQKLLKAMADQVIRQLVILADLIQVDLVRFAVDKIDLNKRKYLAKSNQQDVIDKYDKNTEKTGIDRNTMPDGAAKPWTKEPFTNNPTKLCQQLQVVTEASVEFAKSRGFADFDMADKGQNMLNAIDEEVSEFSSLFNWLQAGEPDKAYAMDTIIKAGYELADILLYTVRLPCRFGFKLAVEQS